MLGWTNVRSDKCRFFTWGRTNVRSDKRPGRTNVLFIYRSDKCRNFSLRSDKCQCVLGSDKCRGRTVGQMSVGQTSVGQKSRHPRSFVCLSIIVKGVFHFYLFSVFLFFSFFSKNRKPKLFSNFASTCKVSLSIVNFLTGAFSQKCQKMKKNKKTLLSLFFFFPVGSPLT